MKRKILFVFLVLGAIVLGKVILSMINIDKSSNPSPFPTIIIIDDENDGTGCLGTGNGSTSEK